MLAKVKPERVIPRPAVPKQRHVFPLLALVLLVLAANAPILSGIANCDPFSRYSGLTLDVKPPLWPYGTACYDDPSTGITTQPLGRIAAQDWLHGEVPWWDPYHGVGLPLAAQMQAEALFPPFVLLLIFKSGWFLQRLVFQLLSGLFGYLFLTVLGRSRLAAFTGAGLYALCAPFFLTASAVVAPAFCLPLLLLGIERLAHSVREARKGGDGLIILALTASFYAGFPETAFIDGLLGLCWAVLRAGQSPYPYRLARRLCLAGLVALLLTLPGLVPFVQYLRLGDLGGHGGSMARAVWPVATAPLSLFPLFYGALAQPPAIGTPSVLYEMWGRVGGWFGCVPVLLALTALCSRRRPPEVWLLAGWVGFWLLRGFGFPLVLFLFNHLIPGMRLVDAIRYSGLALCFAVFALAAYGLDSLPRPRWGPVLLFLACAALALAPALHLLPGWYAKEPALRWLSLLGIAVPMLAALGLGLMRARKTAAASALAGAVLLSLLPQLAAFRGGTPHSEGLDFLKQHQGLGRFYSIGPVSFGLLADGLAGLNYAALPVPRLWFSDIQANLYPAAAPQALGGHGPGAAKAVLAHLAAFEARGVKYILTFPYDNNPFVPGIAPPEGGAPALLTLAPDVQTRQALPALPFTERRIAAVTLYPTLTPGGAGNLRIRLCGDAGCAEGVRPLAQARSGLAFTINLDSALPVTPGQALNLFVAQDGTTPISLLSHGGAWALRLQYPPPPNAPKLAEQSETMDVYELPQPAPYAQAPGCRLTITGRRHMSAVCPVPSHLLRRELFYPGWQARVNGRSVPVFHAAALFQSVELPKGVSEIRFSYEPPYEQLACALALGALLLWGIAAWRDAKLNNAMKKMVGAAGFEPTTPSPPD